MSNKKKDLLQGTLDLLVLRVIQSGPTNGWEITQRIRLISEDALRVNAGSLYPALYRLEKRGWIESEWGTTESNRRAKFYALTTAGRQQLALETETWSRLSKAIDRILDTA